MKLTIDIKTLIIGLLLGILLTLVMGQQSYTGPGKADFGIAVDNRAMALIRANDGTIYAVDPQSARAEIVEFRDGPYRGRPFNLTLSLTRPRERED